MESIDELIDELAAHSGCVVSPPRGLPQLAGDLTLPADVVRFYERTGGATLFKKGIGYRARIVGPEELERIDLAIRGEAYASGPFRFWYAIADVQDGDYLAIDLGPSHPGICLDSFHETFDQPGHVAVVADSFTDLLRRLLRHPPESAYWLQDNFEMLGEGLSLYGFLPLPFNNMTAWD